MKPDLPSGLWSGYYQQHGRRFDQQATLEFADGLIRGDGVDGIGLFRIEGEYRLENGQVRLGWIKTYEGAHSILYLGQLVEQTILGEYNVQGMRGGFAFEPVR
ncbi:MAG: hypothetical protein U0931_36960 [Vulcanimicrobiota bacterium]